MRKLSFILASCIACFAQTDTATFSLDGNLVNRILCDSLLIGQDTRITGDTRVNKRVITDSSFVIGNPTTDGSWRWRVEADSMIAERRESGNWVKKQVFAP